MVRPKEPGCLIIRAGSYNRNWTSDASAGAVSKGQMAFSFRVASPVVPAFDVDTPGRRNSTRARLADFRDKVFRTPLPYASPKKPKHQGSREPSRFGRRAIRS